MRSKAERQAWWRGLSPEEQAARVEGWQARKEKERTSNPSHEVAEATARLDLATERGCFMRDISAADVAVRIAENGEAMSRGTYQPAAWPTQTRETDD